MLKVSIGLLMFILSFVLLAMIPPPSGSVIGTDRQAVSNGVPTVR